MPSYAPGRISCVRESRWSQWHYSIFIRGKLRLPILFVAIAHVGCHQTPPIMKMDVVRAIRESPLREVGRGYFRRNHSCSLAACTTSNEKVCGAEAGNHKGCPYDGFAGAYFRTNRSCRLSPTPPIMKMGLAAASSRGRCRGLDSRLRGNDGVVVALKGGFETRPYE